MKPTAGFELQLWVPFFFGFRQTAFRLFDQSFFSFPIISCPRLRPSSLQETLR